MAIASYKPNTDPVIPVNTPKIQPDNYQGVVYDDNNIPLTSLVAYIEGAPYYCDYFKQVVGASNDLREIDPGQSNVYQQYERINGLEIRVSSALTSSYDSDTGITTVSGSGIIYPFMVPNNADYFVSDAGDNQKGLFRITNVERRTFNRDSAFYVDYELVGYIHTLEALYGDLESKVIREYHFSKERLLEGLQPVLRTSQHNQLTSLSAIYNNLVTQYFKTFLNKEYNTLIIPGQSMAIYDSFLVDFVFKIVDSFQHYDMRLTRQYSIDNNPYMAQPQLWDLLLRKDFKGLSDCNQKMSYVTKYAFNPNGFIHGIYFTNLDAVVYPVTPDVTVALDSHPEARIVNLEPLVEPTNRQGTLADLINNQYISGSTTYPYIHTVTTDDYYVLSQAFYDQTANMSLLEVLVKDYIKQQTIDLEKLLALCDHYSQWGRLEQFSYGPLLMLLIKEANRSNY